MAQQRRSGRPAALATSAVRPAATRPDRARDALARLATLHLEADASSTTRVRALAAVTEIAAGLDVSDCPGEPVGYGRCLLHEDGTGWSLAAIALRPGQAIHAHDHGGWGLAVTVQGVERDRRLIGNPDDGFTTLSERDYPSGTGYLFTATDIHQPVGADPLVVTVALHLLVPGEPAPQAVPEVRDVGVALRQPDVAGTAR